MKVHFIDCTYVRIRGRGLGGCDPYHSICMTHSHRQVLAHKLSLPHKLIKKHTHAQKKSYTRPQTSSSALPSPSVDAVDIACCFSGTYSFALYEALVRCSRLKYIRQYMSHH